MRSQLVGWKEIAHRLGVTVRAAQRYATLERDPLPCYRRLRTVCLDPAELEAWLDRHREPMSDAPTESIVLVPADARVAPVMRLFHRAALRVLGRIDERDRRRAELDQRQVTVDEYVERKAVAEAALSSPAGRRRRSRR